MLAIYVANKGFFLMATDCVCFLRLKTIPVSINPIVLLDLVKNELDTRKSYVKSAR